ncbi:MAG: hypothetical protein PHV02_18475, partial [Rhodocyclaceae bacterium]|nr:hypothetical protein [Rhodocyclaceae bacterium]
MDEMRPTVSNSKRDKAVSIRSEHSPSRTAPLLLDRRSRFGFFGVQLLTFIANQEYLLNSATTLFYRRRPPSTACGTPFLSLSCFDSTTQPKHAPLPAEDKAPRPRPN